MSQIKYAAYIKNVYNIYECNFASTFRMFMKQQKGALTFDITLSLCVKRVRMSGICNCCNVCAGWHFRHSSHSFRLPLSPFLSCTLPVLICDCRQLFRPMLICAKILIRFWTMKCWISHANLITPKETVATCTKRRHFWGPEFVSRLSGVNTDTNSNHSKRGWDRSSVIKNWNVI